MIKEHGGAVVASDAIGAHPGGIAREERPPDQDAPVRRRLSERRTDVKWPRPVRAALILIVPALLWLIILAAAGWL